MTIRILVVCTGNICRSPVGEQVLQSLLDPRCVEVTSAGLGAVVGHDIDATMREAAADAGLTLHKHVARQLMPRMVAESDLTLVMTEAQRSRVLEDSPAALRRCFTLTELARICRNLLDAGRLPWTTSEASASPDDASPDDQEARLRGLIPLAGRFRGKQNPSIPDDVDDPYLRPLEVHARVLADILDAARTLAEAVSD